MSTLVKKFTSNVSFHESQNPGVAKQSTNLLAETKTQPEPVLKKEHSAGSADGAGRSTDEPASREDAFRRIEIIAKYLKRIEPHSPVPYLLERAIRWGGMPLEGWLHEVIQNDDSLKRLRDTLGIKEGPAN